MRPDVRSRTAPQESSIQTIRWAIIGLIVMATPVSAASWPAVFTLAVCAAVFNLALYNRRFNPSTISSMIVDYVAITGAVAATGGLSSPFFAIYFLLIIRSIAAFGIAGFTFALVTQLLTTIALNFYYLPAAELSQWLKLAINLSLVLMFALTAEQHVRRQSDEHLVTNSFSRGAENERQWLLALINSLTHAVLALDHAGKVYLYNAAALEILNTNQDISKQSVLKLLPLHDLHGRKINLIEQLLKHDRTLSRQDLRYKASDGSTLILDLTATPVRTLGYGEKNGGYMVIFRDITKQKSLDEQRDEFISVTSHELRTPLAIAEANLSTALMPGYAKIEPKAVAMVTQAHDNLIFLSELIEDLTTLSRAERDDLKLTSEVVTVAEFTAELVRDYTPQAAAKGLNLTSELKTHTISIVTSTAELREILQNFITNAIKYTQSGTVALVVTSSARGTKFSVQDSGIGISLSDKRKVFEKFYRSEDYRTRQTGGTGLGLYITQKLADKLGASIDFNSRLNYGSTFSVLIPPANGEAAENALEDAANQ